MAQPHQQAEGQYDEAYGQPGGEGYYQDENAAYYDHNQGFAQEPQQGQEGYYDEAGYYNAGEQGAQYQQDGSYYDAGQQGYQDEYYNDQYYDQGAQAAGQPQQPGRNGGAYVHRHYFALTCCFPAS